MKPLLRREWLIILVGNLVLLAVLIPTREQIWLAIGQFLIVQDESIQAADLIHVLGGRSERAFLGIEMLRLGYGHRLLFTGKASVDRAKKMAEASGISPDRFLIPESEADSTYKEALELKQLLDTGASVQSVIIVSSPYHMRRVQLAFTRVLGDRVHLQFVPVPLEYSQHQERWWVRGESSSQKTVLEEYIKLLYYYIRY